ncbi:hypothetical protein BDA99DRAFT_541444 [Phascolomyces articulosus]|uniref:Paired domain-containing protein n=1 Tax=Phascolomyces articulosus TaxID=60185 RepID=A0AAD5JRU1_9FUNG|nr:hypothetical protein BDA99DRAFT_541444 [Phascolomyces articulosus]
MPFNDISNTNNQPSRLGPELGEERKGIIVGRFQAGQKYAKISSDLQLPYNTICSIIQHWQKNGNTKNDTRTGCTEKLNGRDIRMIVRSVRKSPLAPIAIHQAALESAGNDWIGPRRVWIGVYVSLNPLASQVTHSSIAPCTVCGCNRRNFLIYHRLETDPLFTASSMSVRGTTCWSVTNKCITSTLENPGDK